MDEQEIRLQLEKWRGYSAYEVAKKNGFNGTEKEWLESLGADLSVTVNGRQVDDTGDIKVTGEDTLIYHGGQKTIAKRLEELRDTKLDIENIANDLTTTAEGKALDARQGKALSDRLDNYKSSNVRTLTIAGWSSAEPYTQTVSSAGVTTDNVVIASPVPASFENYGEHGVYCSAQEKDKLTFTALIKPTMQLKVNVLILK